MNPYTANVHEIIRRGFTNPRFMQWAIHEKGKELAVEIKWHHMKNYPTHRIEAITSEVEI